MSLREKLIQEIRLSGPLSVAQFMQYVLLDKEFGYYQKQNPFGAQGDFITAPETSQIFAELIALFAIYECDDFKELEEIQIVELGPGNASLLADFLRTAQKFPWFYNKLSLHLVEASERLQEIQRQRLQDFALQITHYQEFADVPKKASFIIANEFLDALPILQFELREQIWLERRVDFKDGEFRFCLLNNSQAKSYTQQFLGQSQMVENGAIFEVSPMIISVFSTICDFIKETKSKALIVDYGYDKREFKPTIQALKKHKYHPLFKDLGEADITALVDFLLLKHIAQEKNIGAFLTSQGNFLNSLGLAQRVEMLIQNKPLNIQEQVKKSAKYLSDPQQMGELFKVLYLS